MLEKSGRYTRVDTMNILEHSRTILEDITKVVSEDNRRNGMTDEECPELPSAQAPHRDLATFLPSISSYLEDADQHLTVLVTQTTR